MRNAKQSQSTDERPPQQWLADTFARCELPLLRYCLRLLGGDHAAAQDVVQEAFVKLCAERWPDIEPHSTAWLYRLCRNRSIDLNRLRGRMNANNSTTDVTAIYDRKTPLPDAQAEQVDELQRVRKKLDQLSEQQQEILRLRLHDNLSYKQIATVTGLTVTNVGYHLHQAIATLREVISR